MQSHNWQVYGHDWAVNQLRKAIYNQRTRHAYLITGIDGIGKRTLAYCFAMAINAPHADGSGNIDYEHRSAKKIMSGNHPDIVLAARDEKTDALKIEAVRELTGKLSLKPYEARYRVAILEDFQKARPQAQDALLKTLEEPAETAVLMVLASSIEGILPTITSRCQILSLRPLAIPTVREVLMTHYNVDPTTADLVARVCGGRIGWAIAAVQAGSTLLQDRQQALLALEEALRGSRAQRFAVADTLGKDKIGALPVLELWLTYWRDVLLTANGATHSLTNIDHQAQIRELASYIGVEQARQALHTTRDTISTLQHTNTNARLALEVMFLDYPGLRVR